MHTVALSRSSPQPDPSTSLRTGFRAFPFNRSRGSYPYFCAIPEPDARDVRHRVSGVLADINIKAVRMKHKSHLFRVVLVVFLGWLSLACTCIMTPVRKHVKDTPVIVMCKVTSLLTHEEYDIDYPSDSTHSYRVEVIVTKRYKGRVKEGQVIEVVPIAGNCDIFFELGSEYILFFSDTGPEWHVRPCSYSGKRENATKALSALERQNCKKSAE